MEMEQEGVRRSFNATPHRLEILRRLTLEFAGVVLKETPSETPGDFMTRVELTFTSHDQGEIFIDKMLGLGRQEIAGQDRPERPS